MSIFIPFTPLHNQNAPFGGAVMSEQGDADCAF